MNFVSKTRNIPSHKKQVSEICWAELRTHSGVIGEGTTVVSGEVGRGRGAL